MEKRAGWLLTVGLLALTVWTSVVGFLMPNWFDANEDCALRFDRPDSGGVAVVTHWFPPTATCDFGGGDVRRFISPATSILLTAAMVVIAAITVVGLYFTIRRFFEPDDVVRSAEGVDLKARLIAQLASGAVLFVLAMGVYTGASAFAIIVGGASGGLVFGLITFAGVFLITAVTGRMPFFRIWTGAPRRGHLHRGRPHSVVAAVQGDRGLMF